MGFFGTVDDDDSQLESIRAHLEPVSHIHPFREAGPFGAKVVANGMMEGIAI